jgi:hypothetical protein
VTARRPRTPHPDSGASLVLAIGFMLMVGLISAGLIGLTTSSLTNRNTLQVLRNRQYSADGAVQSAIVKVRLDTNTAVANNLASTVCSMNGSIVDASMPLNGGAIRVDYVNVCGVIQSGNRGATAQASASDGTVVGQHNVIFSACLNTGAACVPANVIIRAEVNFQQGQYDALVTKTYILSWSVNQ